MGSVFGEPSQPYSGNLPTSRIHVQLRDALYNGFSAGINPVDFRGPGFQTGCDPVWADLMEKYAEEPFRMPMSGGDQLYCDGVIREPELQDLVHTTKQGRLGEEGETVS